MRAARCSSYDQHNSIVRRIVPVSRRSSISIVSEESLLGFRNTDPGVSAAGGGGESRGTSHIPNVAFSCDIWSERNDE